jgi:hypothetical protein
VNADQPTAAVQTIKVLLIEPLEGQPSYLRDLLDDHYLVTHEPQPLRAWDMLMMGHQTDVLLLSTDAEYPQLRQLLTWVRDSRQATPVPVWTFTLGPEDKVNCVAALARPERHLSGPHLLSQLRLALDPALAIAVPATALTPVTDSALVETAPDAVQLWLNNQQASIGQKMLFVGQVDWNLDQDDLSQRPGRFGLLRQMLRAQDDLISEDEGRFWMVLDMNDELIATRVALRMAVALTRSSDPGRFPIAMGLSGCFVNGATAAARRLCLKNLPLKPAHGQIEVSVDRWHFSLPIRVAQTLAGSDQ